MCALKTEAAMFYQLNVQFYTVQGSLLRYVSIYTGRGIICYVINAHMRTY